MASATPPRPSTSSSVRNSGFVRGTGNLSLETPSSNRLPNSPQALSPSRNQVQRTNSVSSPNGKLPPRSPLHRSPSSMSQKSRSSTPTLLRKASMNSLHGVGGITPSRSSSSRRSSSAHYSNASTMVGKSPLSELEDPIPSSPKHTPESIARNHFAAELEAHEAGNGSKPADTIVILHDSCYGHRFARPNTSAYELSTIVERPERINACILGLSMAYVWLGDRHAYGHYPPHPGKNPAEIPAIPFKIHKTARSLPLSSQAVTNVHGVEWMDELKTMCNNAESRLAGSGKELTRPDVRRNSAEKPAEFHTGDLYLCPESLNAMEGALGAVCEGVDAVFNGSASGNGPFRTFVLVRPPGHHCSDDYPSGFCWVNNVHVGIQHAVITHGLTHAAIIDFDLHHGDGSQAITWESNRRAAAAGSKKSDQWKKVSIGYFSCHDIDSYPCEMADVEKVTNASVCIENSHNQSIWNVHLKTWKSEAEFWELYETKYSVLLDKTRNYLRAQTERLRLLPKGPKAKGAIFLSAGFDASEWETTTMQRHPVNVPTEFYARLTRDVVRLAAEEGCAVDGRVISVLEGGYSDRALSTGVLSHLSGLAAGEAVTIKQEISPNGLGYEMVKKIGVYDGHAKRESVTLGNGTYDPSWWSVQKLEQLDAVMNPVPLDEIKKQRDLAPPTYSSPTQSFIAKVNTTSRRTSSSMPKTNESPITMSRPPSPPPPEVDWTTAAHELSKLLIPTNRATVSYRHEDLAVARVKRERQSVVNALPSEAELSNSLDKMTLRRTRQTAKPLVETAEEHEVNKPVSRASRRRTDIGIVSLSADKESLEGAVPAHISGSNISRATASSNRRASIASTGSVASEAPVIRGRRVPPSGVPSASSRPITTQNVRPESSISVRNGVTPPISVSRARKPALPRTDAAKVPRPRKKSPLNGTSLSREETVNAVKTPIGSLPLGTETLGMDSLVRDLARVDIAQKESKPEKAKPKSRATAKAPVARPRKALKPAETVGSGKPQETGVKSVPKEAEMHGLTDSLGGMTVESSKPAMLSSASATVPPKKKITIDMKQLGLRAKGIPKSEPEVSTIKPVNTDSTIEAIASEEGGLKVEAPSQHSIQGDDTLLPGHVSPRFSASPEQAFNNVEEMPDLVTPALADQSNNYSTSEMPGSILDVPEDPEEESVSPSDLALDTASSAGNPTTEITTTNSSEGDLKADLEKGSRIATAKLVKIKLSTHKGRNIYNPKSPVTLSFVGGEASVNGTSTPESLQMPPATGHLLPASSPAGSDFQQPPIPQPVVDTSDGFIAYKPDGPTPSSIQSHEPLRWLAPNTATPSPNKKGSLPVFTSTGAIPFGGPKPNVIAEQSSAKDIKGSNT